MTVSVILAGMCPPLPCARPIPPSPAPVPCSLPNTRNLTQTQVLPRTKNGTKVCSHINKALTTHNKADH